MARQDFETIMIYSLGRLETAVRRPRLFGAGLRPAGMLSIVSY